MAEATSEILVWTDLETTGLDPSTCHILEVACIVTDLDLNPVEATPFHAAVQYTRDEAARLRRETAERVREMHDATGLWRRLPDGVPLPYIERNLLAYIRAHARQPRQARLAGNSVRLDASFLDRQMPRVSQHLHYRLLDVSGIAYLAHEWGGIAYMPKERRHGALEDIQESLEELRYLRAAGMFPRATG